MVHVVLWVVVIFYGLGFAIAFPYDPNQNATVEGVHVPLGTTEPALSSTTTAVAISAIVMTSVGVVGILFHSMFYTNKQARDSTSTMMNMFLKAITAFVVYGMVGHVYLVCMMAETGPDNWRFSSSVAVTMLDVVAVCIFFVMSANLDDVDFPIPNWFFLCIVGSFELLNYVGINSGDFGEFSDGQKALTATTFWVMVAVLLVTAFVSASNTGENNKMPNPSTIKTFSNAWPIVAAVLLALMLSVLFLASYRVSIFLFANNGTQAGVTFSFFTLLLEGGAVTRAFVGVAAKSSHASSDKESKGLMASIS